MNTWQERFTQKLDTVREAAHERFAWAATDVVAPIFEEFRVFAAQRDLHVSAPLEKPGMRTYKFAITENAYVFMTFRPSSIDGCEMHSEFFVPNGLALEPTTRRTALVDVDQAWARGVFEHALDTFVDAFVDSLLEREEQEADAEPSPTLSPKTRSRKEAAVRR